jgi:hypothetical protein
MHIYTSANGIFACLGLGLQKWGAQAGRVLENGSRRNDAARAPMSSGKCVGGLALEGARFLSQCFHTHYTAAGGCD